MHKNFTRGLIAGTLIGTAMSMMMPNRTNARFKRKLFKNGSHFAKRAGGVLGDILDMW